MCCDAIRKRPSEYGDNQLSSTDHDHHVFSTCVDDDDSMAQLLISPLTEVFRWGLEPIAPFTWFGFPISTLDVLATFRLCLVLRQVREIMHNVHASKKNCGPTEESSFVKRVATTLLVVYGGEAITGES